jgi:cyclopropane fatty-acyl-phospholipid synthase-like methyltransferase
MHVLDLGCGVGASLIYLATRAPIRGTGVTISGVQADYAGERISNAGLADRVRCVQANFLELPPSIEPAQLVFSIEAFVHGPDPARYFESAAGRLTPRGLLIVCDDFLAPRARGPVSRRDARIIDEFRRGWHANSLMTVAEADALATAAGFTLTKNLNLTASLELRRPRDLLVSLAMTIGRHLPLRGTYGDSLLGGSALQAGLGSGLIEFRYLVWQFGA